jgi:hypothetical protein
VKRAERRNYLVQWRADPEPMFVAKERMVLAVMVYLFPLQWVAEGEL